MAYVEHALGAAHVTGERDVAPARKQFDQLRTLAPSPARCRWSSCGASLREAGHEGGRAMELDGPAWRTGSCSGSNGASCVEVARLTEGVAVRDTEDRSRAPHVHSATAWAAFVAGVRAGEFAA